ncbi:MAG TPA: SET domain-containing protein-lysine N-methyltransferase, partial [Verrucomicrobiae bacterium]|nr:SET domain-containing protein-lysine N-methyltransferase [Verrucomicrobiae bacterium]
ELVVDFSEGDGDYVSEDKLQEVWSPQFDYCLQVDDDLYFAAVQKHQVESADYVNHSCDPTCGVKDKLKLVAMRDIHPGEEITFDYAMTESSDYSFECNCGRTNCRKKVTGDDWKIPELQKKYKGYFSEYLEKKIVAQ